MKFPTHTCISCLGCQWGNVHNTMKMCSVQLVTGDKTQIHMSCIGQSEAHTLVALPISVNSQFDMVNILYLLFYFHMEWPLA